MDPGEGARTPTTGNEFYNVVAVLYHALHGNETIGIYLQDAETAGNARQAEFFREAQDMQRRLADMAREELNALEGGAAGAREATTTEPGTPREATATDVRDVRAEEPTTTEAEPPRSGAPGTTPQPEDVPPRTEETAPLGREDATRRQPEREREEDRGFLDRARDAILGEEEEEPRRRREGPDRPEEERR